MKPGNRPRNSLYLMAMAMGFGMVAAMANAAGPARFIDLAAPDHSVAISSDAQLKLFSAASEAGIRLHNASEVEISIQDTVSLVVLKLSPGMRLGLQCDSARHIAINAGGDTAYESVDCGSLLHFSTQRGKK